MTNQNAEAASHSLWHIVYQEKNGGDEKTGQDPTTTNYLQSHILDQEESSGKGRGTGRGRGRPRGSVKPRRLNTLFGDISSGDDNGKQTTVTNADSSHVLDAENSSG